MNERLTRRDWTLIAVCCGIALLSLFVVFNWFYAAFPEASIVAPDSTTSRPNKSTAPPTDPVATWRPLLNKCPVLPPSMITCPPGPTVLLADITAAVVAT